METAYCCDGTKSTEGCSECMRSYFNRRSRKVGAFVANSKRPRCNGFGLGTPTGHLMQALSRKCVEDNSVTNGSCDGSIVSDFGESDEKRNCPLRLRIRSPQPCQSGCADSFASPCSESNGHDNGGRLLRVRIRPPWNEVSFGLNIRNEGYKCIEPGQDNNPVEDDVRKASKRPERRHNHEQLVESKEGVSDHWNRIHLRIHGNGNRSTTHTDDKVKTPLLTRRSACEREQSSRDSGCARTEHTHVRGERSKVSIERVALPERSGGLYITYDSRRKRSDPGLPDLFVSKSQIHGQGVFTRNTIQKGLIILEFFGEIIRESVSDVRERRYLDAGMHSSYVFSLADGGRQTDRFCLDSTRKGGLGRFINHCCLPNSAAEILGQGIVIRTLRDVDCGEEITLDYKMRDGREKCWCGAENCLGVLGGSG